MKKINKNLVLVFLISLSFISLMKAQEPEKTATGKIYFLRSTGFAGSASAFKIFIDNEFVCNSTTKNILYTKSW